MLNFALIKLSFSLMLGVILGFYFHFPVSELLAWGILILIFFAFSYFRAKKLFFPDYLFGISCFALFIFLGIFTTSIHLPENQPKHFINTTAKINGNEIAFAEVSEKLKPGSYQDKYLVSINEIDGKPVHGKILLNISRLPKNNEFEPGDKLILPAEFEEINSPLNPYQFNYRNYMANLGVLKQINLDPSRVLKTGSEDLGLKTFAGKIRWKIVEELKEFNFTQNELAIIQALLLGQRQDISAEIYENYAAAGVIHILAVSGLHVGILLLLLNRLFKPIERIKKGKLIKTLLLLLSLWIFALVAGLSPSVVRAVTMFSFVAIGMQLKRRTSVLNSLFVSLMFLLLINPHFIHQVGFQLSYAAVFSIVLIQPRLSQLYTPNNRILRYFWGILTVTIAAQIGVLPLSLFYFHQFPGLFFISNLVILPFLGLILAMGILVSFLAVTGWLPQVLASVYGWMITSLNKFASWIASKEEYIFQDIYFSLLFCIAFYFLILGLIFILKKFSYRNFVFILVAVIGVQAAFIYERFSEKFEEAIIFHKSRNSLIGIKTDNDLKVYNDPDTTGFSQRIIQNYSTGTGLKTTANFPLKNFYEIDGKKLLLIDNNGIYQIAGFQPDLVLLANSPRVNLERLILDLNPKTIIADGSNYPSLISRWKATALHKKIPFHITGEKGAFYISTTGKIPEFN